MLSDTVEGIATSVHLEYNATKCPKVRGRQRDTFLQHLWGHVKRRADKCVSSHLQVLEAVAQLKGSWLFYMAYIFTGLCFSGVSKLQFLLHVIRMHQLFILDIFRRKH